jgi:hypothetical protein
VAERWSHPGPDWWRALLQRPELAPVPESCRAERALHAALNDDPLQAVAPDRLAAMADADARESWGHFLAWRDGVVHAGTLEGWLLALWRSRRITVPPLFIELAVQAVVGQLVADETDPTRRRAAELLFRPQRVARNDDGRVLLHDLEPGAAAPLDITHRIGQDLGHGLVFQMTWARSGLRALADVLQLWTRHLLGVAVTIEPLERIADPHWRWHLGLDAESSTLLNDLYEDREVEAERRARLLSLFRLRFDDPAEMHPDLAGAPVWLGLMADAQQVVRLKPQNLLLNLPLARLS